MFFVGATGQLLTLLLAVGLPFVFLVTGHQKLEIADASNILHITSVQSDSNFSDLSTVDYSDVVAKTENQEISAPQVYHPIKIPLVNEGIKWKTVGLDHSGNKAPPVS